jgi:hypothetical protein
LLDESFVYVAREIFKVSICIVKQPRRGYNV